MEDKVELYGIKDGKEVFLGMHTTPPQMKAREILRSYGFNDLDDEDSMDACAMWAVEEVIAYCKKYYQSFEVNSDDA